MKILFYYLYGSGGALENMKLLYRALADLPSVSEVVVVCSAASTLCELRDHAKIKLVTCDRIMHRELNRLYMGLRGLKAIVARERPDVVLAMNLSSYVPLGVPSALSINNPYQVYPEDIDVYHPKNGFGIRAMRWFFRRSLDLSDGVILQTDLMRDYTRKIMRRPIPAWTIGKAVEGELEMVSEPVSENMAQALEVAKGEGRFRFLYVATPMPHKNHLVLYRAMELVRSKGLPIHVLLTLSLADVEATGGDLGVSLVDSGHIVPLGFVEKRHLRAVYHEADACVMPSVLESLSSSHLEAMAWRRPQIVADLPYSRDLCHDAAVYCPPNDHHAWASNMQSLASNETLRDNLVSEGERIIQMMPRTITDAAQRLENSLRAVVESFSKAR